MKSPNNNQFGLIIAYLLPGFIGLAGLAPFVPAIEAWLQPRESDVGGVDEALNRRQMVVQEAERSDWLVSGEDDFLRVHCSGRREDVGADACPRRRNAHDGRVFEYRVATG